MIDLNKAAEVAARAFPDKDPERLREVIKNLVEEVRAATIDRGNFIYHSTYGIRVQKIWFEEEPTPDAVGVFLDVASDYDLTEEDLV